MNNEEPNDRYYGGNLLWCTSKPKYTLPIVSGPVDPEYKMAEEHIQLIMNGETPQGVDFKNLTISLLDGDESFKRSFLFSCGGTYDDRTADTILYRHYRNQLKAELKAKRNEMRSWFFPDEVEIAKLEHYIKFLDLILLRDERHLYLTLEELIALEEPK